MSFIRNVAKKWKRISESKSTVSFVLVSIIQALVLIYLQFRIFERNSESINIIMELNKTNQLTESCYNGPLLSFFTIILENVMFILFYFFQIYFCFNAIFHQDTMQIMTITSMNFVFVLIGIMQAIEVKNVDSKLGELCPELQFDPKIMTYEISFIVVVSLLGILMGYLSFNLYRRFGWKIYKKYGFDKSMQKLYRTRLIFVMLLKLDLLLMILFSGLVLPTFYIMYKSKNLGQKFLIFASSAILILVFFFEALAYRSIKKEWKAGMTSFIIFWIFAMLNFAGLYYGVINSSVTTYRYIGFVVGIICCSFVLGTFIFAVYVRKGFGRGLKEYLDKERNEKTPKASGSKYQNI